MHGPHILIVGSGSVGRRHARNLATLGCRISCVDPRADRRAELSSEVPTVAGHPHVSEALATHHDLTGVVIGSPPVFHVDQATEALQRGIPVLLEKPISPELQGAVRLERLTETGLAPLLLGYTWRWWEPLRKARDLIEANTIGTLRHVRMVISAHLADWHPWERYQDFFMSSKALGGGALLDKSLD